VANAWGVIETIAALAADDAAELERLVALLERRHAAAREFVHHRNGVRSDNRLENLEVLPNQAAHMRLHQGKGHRMGTNAAHAFVPLPERARLLGAEVEQAVDAGDEVT
jgi:HNH endonuclease